MKIQFSKLVEFFKHHEDVVRITKEPVTSEAATLNGGITTTVIEEKNNENGPAKEVVKEPSQSTRPWTRFFTFTKSTLAAKGMSFSFVPPTVKNGLSVAQLEKEEVHRL